TSQISNDDFAIVLDRLTNRKLTLRSLLAAYDLPFQFLARIEIDAFGIRDMTARAHKVEIIFFTNLAHGVVVGYPKSMRFGSLQLVENLAILISAFGERVLILSAADDRGEDAVEGQESCDNERSESHLAEIGLGRFNLISTFLYFAVYPGRCPGLKLANACGVGFALFAPSTLRVLTQSSSTRGHLAEAPGSSPTAVSGL